MDCLPPLVAAAVTEADHHLRWRQRAARIADQIIREVTNSKYSYLALCWESIIIIQDCWTEEGQWCGFLWSLWHTEETNIRSVLLLELRNVHLFKDYRWCKCLTSVCVKLFDWWFLFIVIQQTTTSTLHLSHLYMLMIIISVEGFLILFFRHFSEVKSESTPPLINLIDFKLSPPV